MNNFHHLPLAAQAFSRAAMTTLVQVLSEDAEATVTALDSAPLDAPHSPNRYERLRVRWAGPRGEGEHAFVLKGLPDITWSEAVRPTLPAPADVLLIEGDLSTVFGSVVEDDAIAAGRRTPPRPAWILAEAQAGEPLPPDADEAVHQWVLQKSAAFHALHWGALPVLDEVYPWLPRFDEWVRVHCAFLAQLLESGSPPDNAYGQRIVRRWPDFARHLVAFWESNHMAGLEPLQRFLRDPSPLLRPLADTPHTILHGNWQRDEMARRGEQLVVREWRYVQVGPAAWDLCTYLSEQHFQGEAPFDAAASISLYLDQVATIIPELSAEERGTFRRAYDICRVLDLLLHPKRWEIVLALPSHAATHRWLSQLGEFTERLVE